jgi:hypothetical protein
LPADVAARLRALGYDPVWEDPALVSAGAERRLRRGGAG